jgi:hypothetical protein
MEKTEREVEQFLKFHPDIARVLELFPQIWVQYLRFIALVTPKEARSETVSTKGCHYRGYISRPVERYQ